MNSAEVKLLVYKEFWEYCYKATMKEGDPDSFEKLRNCKEKLIQAYKFIKIPIENTIIGNQEEMDTEQDSFN